MARCVIRGGLRGYERLKLLARDRQPDASALLVRVGFSPGMRCVDLGCGGGEVSFELARLGGPDCIVVGIDIDDTKFALEKGWGLHANDLDDRYDPVVVTHQRLTSPTTTTASPASTQS
ncbi:MAG: methyltransferase domain-containing protein [Acidimicrobiia bacterium]